jgi:hypothetical protein
MFTLCNGKERFVDELITYIDNIRQLAEATLDELAEASAYLHRHITGDANETAPTPRRAI